MWSSVIDWFVQLDWTTLAATICFETSGTWILECKYEAFLQTACSVLKQKYKNESTIFTELYPNEYL